MLSKQPEEKLLQTFLTSLLKLQNVERGSIWVKRGKHYFCVESMGRDSEGFKGVRIDAKRPSIVGWVINNNKMTIAKPGEDERHYHEIESDLKAKSKLILCFPLVMKTGRVYGALQLIDTSAKGKKLNLDKNYLELIENMVNVGAVALSNYIAYNHQLKETKKLNRILTEIRKQDVIIGQSENFLRELKKVSIYAGADFPVLITGESGTGKDIVARELHRQSARKDNPYLVQNCSAIPEMLLESELFGYKKGAFTGANADKTGLFEDADGGTVFLDEIGDMPTKLQARILRIIQDGEVKPLGTSVSKKVDVRIISATNAELPEAISEKRFREDLFYRLSTLPLHLPPLRERKEDILLLLNNFIARESKRMGIKSKTISPEAARILVQYPWPGNIRELENFVKYTILLTAGGNITPENLPVHIVSDLSLTGAASNGGDISPVSLEAEQIESKMSLYNKCSWRELEKDYVHFLLDKYKWNVTKCAKQADLKRSTFDSRMQRLGISK